MLNANVFAVHLNALFDRCFDFPITPLYDYIILLDAVIFDIFGFPLFVPMMKDDGRIGSMLGGGW
jgi:hypothetical protein